MRNPRTRTALGRNLGSLLGRPGNSPAREHPTASTPSLSPGISALVHGAPKDPPAAERGGPSQSGGSQSPPANQRGPVESLPVNPGRRRRTQRLLQGSLLLADLALVLLVARLAFGGDIQLGAWGTVLCAVAVTLGGWLSWMAFRLE